MYASKRLVDVLLCGASLVLWLPLFLLTALLVYCSLGRPIFFRQTRIGRDEVPFLLTKFRTMKPAQNQGESEILRLSPIGRFLRKTSLDELPEWLHIARGEMSWVGPRPLLPEYLPFYTPTERQRHRVRPGLTGWAQIHGRNALAWDQRLALDVWYVAHQSLGLDLRILCLTFGRFFQKGDVVISPRLDDERSAPPSLERTHPGSPA